MKKTIGFIGNFIPHFSTENDRKWSFKKLGHEVVVFQENKTTADKLMSEMQELDVLFYSHTHDPAYSINGLKNVFAEYKKNNVPTASVHLDRWAWLDREKDIGNEATWFTQYQFMADASPEAEKLYKELGLNWHWIKPGVVERDCYMAKPNRAKFPHDIVFVGSRGYHQEYKFRADLIDWLKKTYGNQFGHYGNDGIRVVRGKELNELYASAKIVVGDSCFGGRPGYWSDRVTETMGRGGFLIHPPCLGLEIPSMVNYQKMNLESLGSTIKFWLNNDKMRECARLDNHNWVKKYETYTNRSKEMLSII